VHLTALVPLNFPLSSASFRWLNQGLAADARST
jgi:hypothetical protein